MIFQKLSPNVLATVTNTLKGGGESTPPPNVTPPQYKVTP